MHEAIFAIVVGFFALVVVAMFGVKLYARMKKARRRRERRQNKRVFDELF